LATPPGTKIRLNREVKLWNGFILLDAKNLQFLGGEVPDLIEEWKVQQVKSKMLISGQAVTLIIINYH
jgi:hypothetical protein